MKYRTRLFSALLLGLLLAVSASAAPMTHNQVVAMVNQKGLDWAADWIATVYTAVPAVTMPGLTAIATGTDLAVSTDGPIAVDVADKLAYKLSVGPWTFRGVVPHIDPWKLLGAGAIGFGVGALVTIVVEAVTGHLK